MHAPAEQAGSQPATCLCCMPAACLLPACCLPVACLLPACCLPVACLLPAPTRPPVLGFVQEERNELKNIKHSAKNEHGCRGGGAKAAVGPLVGVAGLSGKHMTGRGRGKCSAERLQPLPAQAAAGRRPVPPLLCPPLCLRSPGVVARQVGAAGSVRAVVGC